MFMNEERAREIVAEEMEEKTRRLGRLIVGNCPKCKHRTLQEENVFWFYPPMCEEISETRICLTCGVVLEHHNEWVPIEKPK